MPETPYPGRITFGLLPEPEGTTASFVTSSVVNLTILALLLLIGVTAKRAIDQHQYEQTDADCAQYPSAPAQAEDT